MGAAGYGLPSGQRMNPPQSGSQGNSQEEQPRQSTSAMGAQRASRDAPDLMQRAKKDPEAYRQALRQANPDASEAAIDQRVRQFFGGE